MGSVGGRRIELLKNQFFSEFSVYNDYTADFWQFPLAASAAGKEPVKTWVQRIFEGTLTNETRCLTCETITSRDEVCVCVCVCVSCVFYIHILYVHICVCNTYLKGRSWMKHGFSRVRRLLAAMRCACVYRVAKTHRIPYLYRSFSAKEPYI